jgi:hypothetical protein
VIGEPAVDLFGLLVSENKLICVRSDTLPQALEKFETLGDRQSAKLVDRDAHASRNVLRPGPKFQRPTTNATAARVRKARKLRADSCDSRPRTLA